MPAMKTCDKLLTLVAAAERIEAIQDCGLLEPIAKSQGATADGTIGLPMQHYQADIEGARQKRNRTDDARKSNKPGAVTIKQEPAHNAGAPSAKRMSVEVPIAESAIQQPYRPQPIYSSDMVSSFPPVASSPRRLSIGKPQEAPPASRPPAPLCIAACSPQAPPAVSAAFQTEIPSDVRSPVPADPQPFSAESNNPAAATDVAPAAIPTLAYQPAFTPAQPGRNIYASLINGTHPASMLQQLSWHIAAGLPYREPQTPCSCCPPGCVGSSPSCSTAGLPQPILAELAAGDGATTPRSAAEGLPPHSNSMPAEARRASMAGEVDTRAAASLPLATAGRSAASVTALPSCTAAAAQVAAAAAARCFRRSTGGAPPGLDAAAFEEPLPSPPGGTDQGPQELGLRQAMEDEAAGGSAYPQSTASEGQPQPYACACLPCTMRAASYKFHGGALLRRGSTPSASPSRHDSLDGASSGGSSNDPVVPLHSAAPRPLAWPQAALAAQYGLPPPLPASCQPTGDPCSPPGTSAASRTPWLPEQGAPSANHYRQCPHPPYPYHYHPYYQPRHRVARVISAPVMRAGSWAPGAARPPAAYPVPPPQHSIPGYPYWGRPAYRCGWQRSPEAVGSYPQPHGDHPGAERQQAQQVWPAAPGGAAAATDAVQGVVKVRVQPQPVKAAEPQEQRKQPQEASDDSWAAEQPYHPSNHPYLYAPPQPHLLVRRPSSPSHVSQPAGVASRTGLVRVIRRSYPLAAAAATPAAASTAAPCQVLSPGYGSAGWGPVATLPTRAAPGVFIRAALAPPLAVPARGQQGQVHGRALAAAAGLQTQVRAARPRVGSAGGMTAQLLDLQLGAV